MREAESAADRARRLWTGEARSTALALLKELLGEPEPEEAIQVLLPWITDRVRAAVRTDVRKAEEAAFAHPVGYPDRVAQSYVDSRGGLPSLNNLELLLELPVLVPRPGSRSQAVPWKDMTVADHQARIGMLARPVNALRVTMRRHEWSIQEIEKHGVRCLGDISITVLRRDLPRDL